MAGKVATFFKRAGLTVGVLLIAGIAGIGAGFELDRDGFDP